MAAYFIARLRFLNALHFRIKTMHDYRNNICLFYTYNSLVKIRAISSLNFLKSKNVFRRIVKGGK